jgi:hypothetical protein
MAAIFIQQISIKSCQGAGAGLQRLVVAFRAAGVPDWETPKSWVDLAVFALVLT